MPPTPRPSFRQRMGNFAKGAGRQAMGGGYQLPPVGSGGLALAPLQGAAGLIGLGGVFASLQQGIMQTFEKTRALESQGTRFRAGLGLTDAKDKKVQFLSSMLTDKRADTLSLSSADIGRVATIVAQSGAEFKTKKEATDTAFLTSAIERGFNVQVENQAQFLSAFSKAGMAQKVTRDGEAVSVAQQGQEALRRALSVGMDEGGAGLMSAEIPKYLQEMNMMMMDQTRQGIRLDASSIMGLGQKFRDSVTHGNRRLFQGFAGLASSQGMIGTARGVFDGQASGLDQSLMLSALRKTRPDADLFELASVLETGGKGGKEYAVLFESLLNTLKDMTSDSSSRRALAFSLKQNSHLFGNMSYDQILALLEGGGNEANIETLTDKQIQGRAEAVTGAGQKTIARIDRADVADMKGQGYTNRLDILKTEAETVRKLRGAIRGMELKSIKLVSGTVENVQRISSTFDLLNAKLNNKGLMGRLRDFLGAIGDLVSDIPSGEATLTNAEKRVRRKRARGGKR